MDFRNYYKIIFSLFTLSISFSSLAANPEKIEYPLTAKVEKKYRVGLILFNASNKKIVGEKGNVRTFYTPQQLGDAYFKHDRGVNRFIQSISYGKVGFEGTVLGWIDLPVIKSVGTEISKNKDKYGEIIMQHLDLSKYDIFILHFLTEGHQDNRGWTLGNSFLINKKHYYAGLGFMINTPFYKEFEHQPFNPSTSASDILEDKGCGRANSINAIYPSDIWAHEMIHTLGIMGHALSLDCGQQILSKVCSINAYGNVFSIMGERAFGNHLDTTMMEDLKWLSRDSIVYTTSPGKHVLDPLETRSMGKKAIVIPLKKPFEVVNKNNGQAVKFSKLRIEYRKPLEYDDLMSRLDGSPYLKQFYTDKKPIQKNGVLVSLDYETEAVQSTVLLDMNPTTSFSERGLRLPGNTGKFADSMLPVGSSKTIDDLGIEISAIKETAGGGVEVEIKMDPTSEYLYDKNQSVTPSMISPLTAKKDELFSNFSTNLVSTFKDSRGWSVYIVKMNIDNKDLLGMEDHSRLKEALNVDAKKYPYQSGARNAVLYYYNNHSNIPNVSNAANFGEAMNMAQKSMMNFFISIEPDGTLKVY